MQIEMHKKSIEDGKLKASSLYLDQFDVDGFMRRLINENFNLIQMVDLKRRDYQVKRQPRITFDRSFCDIKKNLTIRYAFRDSNLNQQINST